MLNLRQPSMHSCRSAPIYQISIGPRSVSVRGHGLLLIYRLPTSATRRALRDLLLDWRVGMTLCVREQGDSLSGYEPQACTLSRIWRHSFAGPHRGRPCWGLDVSIGQWARFGWIENSQLTRLDPLPPRRFQSRKRSLDRNCDAQAALPSG